MSRLLPFLLAAVLAAGARAQAPRALNALPLPSADAARLLAPGILGEHASPPDTTRPWRYYPLHVGDVWEYLDYFSGDVLRREIYRDTVYNGHRYLMMRYFRAVDGGPLEPDPNLPIYSPYRFDTTSALVYTLAGNGVEFVSSRVPCPFDADFGSTVECPQGGDAYFTGGYDGVLVFGGSFPGTGEDTVRTAWKQFERQAPHLRRYAADFGEVYVEMEYDTYGLYYARIDGVEYGVPRYPVGAEPGPEPEGGEALVVWPNPAQGWARVAFTPAEGGAVGLAVHDALGRRVRELTVAARPGARVEATLDLYGLSPGLYVVRAVGARTQASARLTVLW
jgi:hypothetical protein